jgi:hypothetical protein
MIRLRIFLLLLGCALLSEPVPSFAGQAKPVTAINMATGAPLNVIPGGGTVAVEADDQDNNRLSPGLFTWAVPAGANFGVQETANGWLLSAPVGAVPGTWQVLVQYKPDPTLSPTASVTIGKPITAIKIVTTPQ